MEVRLLGRLEIDHDGRPVELGRRRERCLLGVLLLHASAAVSVDRLTDLLWDGDPPPTARAHLHTTMSRLRTRLRADLPTPQAPRLLTVRNGYVAHVDQQAVDVHRFRQHLEQARLVTDPPARTALLRRALSLWRGPLLADVASERLRERVGANLGELRRSAIEDLMEAELAGGRHRDVIGELTAATAEDPRNERLVGQLMLALFRCGRQAEALAAYQRLRAELADELGLDPGVELRRLHAAILRDDPALAAPAGPASVEPPGRRRTDAAGHQPPVPRQLPAPVGNFVGREDALRWLDTLLPGDGDGRSISDSGVVIVVVSGMAGVGKTALALRWANRAADRFPDGQLHIDLRGHGPGAPVEPAQALARFLHALGEEPSAIPADPEEAAGQYRSLLAGRRVLVVLDNAESADQIRPLLPGSPGCLVLVTTRSRLTGLAARDGAVRLPLPVLTADESTDMLTQILGPLRSGAEPAAVAELARLCGHLPLALRIAAARLADNPHQTVAGFAAALTGDRLGHLDVHDDEYAAVSVAFTHSYTRLPAPERRLFRLLGLVPGPDFTAASAAALVDGSAGQVHRTLELLATAHLIERSGPGRYAFHDLLRTYAEHRARDEETAAARDAALRRWYDHHVEFAHAATRQLYPDSPRLVPTGADAFDTTDAALAWLDTELPNLTAAVAEAARRGPSSVAWLLVDALRPHMWIGRTGVDWSALSTTALSAAEAAEDLAGQASAQLSLGQAYFRHRGRYDRAERHWRNAASLAELSGWRIGHAAALTDLGAACGAQGRMAESAELHHRALALKHDIGWHRAVAVDHANLGILLRELGAPGTAAEHGAKAVTLYREKGSRSGEVIALINLAETQRVCGALSSAVDGLHRAVDLSRQIRLPGVTASAREGLAAVHRDLGELDLALDHVLAAMDIARDHGDRDVEAWTVNTAASIQLRIGRSEQAAEHYAGALRMARELGLARLEAEALVGLGRAGAVDGDLDSPVGRVEEGLRLARAAGYRLVEGEALSALADVTLRAGGPEDAVRYAGAALDIHRQAGYRLAEARTLLVLAEARTRIGCRDVADLDRRAAWSILHALAAATARNAEAFVAAHAGY